MRKPIKTLSLRFSVSDTGIGIAADRIERLFKSFSQVDASTTRRFGGTGLGLAISQRLVELLGGQIGVESEPERGSTFWFTTKVEKETPPAHSGGLRYRSRPDFRKVWCLVVDDNTTSREILVQQLQGWGVVAISAANGQEAMDLLRDGRDAGSEFTAILIDYHLPDTDGLALADAIRAESQTSIQNLILMSPVSEAIDPQLLDTHGITSTLSKPIRQSQLFDVLITVVNHGRPQELPGSVAPQTPSVTTDVGSKDGLPVRILLTEDNEINQMVAGEVLRQAGYEYDLAANGIEALQAVTEHRYDLVLMDCQMPEMDGLEATRQIRKLEEDGQVLTPNGQRLPILALTANAVKGDREICIEAGMDDYLTKPLDTHRLIEAIQAHIYLAVKETQPGQTQPADDVDHPSQALQHTTQSSEEATDRTSAETDSMEEPASPTTNGSGLDSPVSPQPDPADAIEPSTPASGLTRAAIPLPPPETETEMETELHPSGEPSQPPTNCPNDVVHIEDALQRCMGNVQLLARMLDKFQERSLQDIQEMTQLIKDQDADRLARLAHSLKGAAANLSIGQVSEAASQLETTGRQRDWDAASELLDRLREELDRFISQRHDAFARITDQDPPTEESEG